ncbi:MAG: tRNA pseudouridine(54/55) synthase Pus10 [Candidatus Micrarchaeota archaeon]|nr:tRNA pseudouridine(54/55) synthase Pus10 [Candidatus Micrarchaeota archaeon]
MATFSLCRHCLSRFRGGAAHLQQAREGCHICSGLLAQQDRLVRSALEQSWLFEWRSFSVSSSFPKSVFLREEEVADFFKPGSFISIKNSANACLAEKISSATSAKPSQRFPEAVFHFDFGKSTASVSPQPVFVFGRYIKLSRSHCQSRWHCSACGGGGCPECKGSGRNYPSVEDELGSALAAGFEAGGFRLHASGREDVDVRCLGTGRPFVMQLSGPKKRNCDLSAIEQKLASNPHVRAVGLRLVQKHFVDAVCNSHFEKEYSALVSASRPLGREDAKKAESLSGAALSQRTPLRVLSRRSDLVRRRRIIWLKASPTEDGRLRILLRAEAGTYIKEMVSGDGGRTTPSLSSVLGCRASCDELDVIAIHDAFLETLFQTH